MANNIRFLIMDVDGTLTDGQLYMSEHGEMMKVFNVKDGQAIANILPRYSIIPIIITGRQSSIVEKRCHDLHIIELHQNAIDKVNVMLELIDRYSKQDLVSYDLSNVAYIGDDELDLDCMKLIKKTGGLVGCPADAIQDIINISDFISSKRGGKGAVREFVDFVVRNC